jgi:hypothetical protein
MYKVNVQDPCFAQSIRNTATFYAVHRTCDCRCHLFSAHLASLKSNGRAYSWLAVEETHARTEKFKYFCGGRADGRLRPKRPLAARRVPILARRGFECGGKHPMLTQGLRRRLLRYIRCPCAPHVRRSCHTLKLASFKFESKVPELGPCF